MRNKKQTKKVAQTHKRGSKTRSNSSEYNHAYYLAHKDDKAFQARRKRNQQNRRPLTPAEKRKRNAHLRERWAKDPAFRKRMMSAQSAYAKRRYATDASYREKLLAYQKVYRQKRKALLARGGSKAVRGGGIKK
jgi:hypothetical protein